MNMLLDHSERVGRQCPLLGRYPTGSFLFSRAESCQSATDPIADLRQASSAINVSPMFRASIFRPMPETLAGVTTRAERRLGMP